MTERDQICERLVRLASRAAQHRWINSATQKEYLVPEELLEDAHDCIRRVRAIPKARAAVSDVAVQAIFDLEPLLVAVTNDVVCSEHLVDGEPKWSAVRQQAARCLEVMNFDLAEWEKKEGLGAAA